MTKKIPAALLIVGLSEITIGIFKAVCSLYTILFFIDIMEELHPHIVLSAVSIFYYLFISFLGALLLIYLGAFLLILRPAIRRMHVILSSLIAVIIVNFFLWVSSGLNYYFPLVVNLNYLIMGIFTLAIITAGYVYYFNRSDIVERFK